MLWLPLLLACLPDSVILDATEGVSFSGAIETDASLAVSTDRATVGLFPLNPNSSEIELLDPIDTHETSGIVGGTATFALMAPAEPESAHLRAVWGTNDSGSTEADYVIGAWEERDGVLGLSEGDTLVGAAYAMATWYGGTLHADTEAAGGALGWNLVDWVAWTLGTDVGYISPASEGADDLTLPTNLFAHEPENLEVTAFRETSGAGIITLVSLVGACEGRYASSVVAESAYPRGTELMTLEGPLPAPNESDYVDQSALEACPDLAELLEGFMQLADVRVALYVAVAFDADGSCFASSLEGSNPILVVYFEPTGLLAGFLGGLGGGMGWQVLSLSAVDETSLFVDWDTDHYLGRCSVLD